MRIDEVNGRYMFYKPKRMQFIVLLVFMPADVRKMNGMIVILGICNNSLVIGCCVLENERLFSVV